MGLSRNTQVLGCYPRCCNPDKADKCFKLPHDETRDNARPECKVLAEGVTFDMGQLGVAL